MGGNAKKVASGLGLASALWLQEGECTEAKGESFEEIREKMTARPVRFSKGHLLRGTLAKDDALKSMEYFYWPDNKDEIACIIELGSDVCGHPGIAHGGVTAAVLDDVLGALCYRRGSKGGVTANLSIDYRRPIRPPTTLLAKAKFVRQERRKVYIAAHLEDSSGKVYAEAKGLFILPRKLPETMSSSGGGSAF
eukprot:jgi/Bigna1/71344/fgenesh1_pg.15_\